MSGFCRLPVPSFAALLTVGIGVLQIVAPGPSDAQPFQLAPPVASAAGLRQLVPVDMDGDGDLDVLATSSIDDEVFWLENDGLSWSKIVLDVAPTTTDGAFDAVPGDLDGDGDIDVVASARDAGDLVYWLNGGDGTTWTRDMISTTVAGIRDLALGDLDLDGDLDVVAAVTGAGDLRWWEQTPTGWTGRVIEGSATGVRSVALADMDGDGDLDVIAPVPGADLAWWENPRSGASPWTSEVIGAVVDPSAVAAGDIDGDGAPEVLVADQDDDSVTRWRYVPDVRGAGLWKPEPVAPAGDVTTPTSFDLVDFDGDQDLDLFVASGDVVEGRWYVWDRALGIFVGFDLPTAPASRPRWRAADFDGDGDRDLLTIERPSSGDDHIVVLSSRRPHRDPRFLAAEGTVTAFVNGADPVFARGDIDGDGIEDLVVADGAANFGGGVQWLRNPQSTTDGAPFFVSTPIGSAGQAADTFDFVTGLAIGDFDQDGDNDLMVGEQDSAVKFVDFCENIDGAGTDWDCQLRAVLDSMMATDLNFDVVGRMEAGDINGDGLLDFVAMTDAWDGNTDYAGLYWFENLGDVAGSLAAFAAHEITDLAVGVTRLQIIDFDKDGDLDVAGTAEYTGGALQFQLFQNDGSGGFGSGYSILLNDDFRLADLDGDGIIDLISLYETQARIQWAQGTGSSTFFASFANTTTEIVSFTADTPPDVTRAGGLDVADVDGDGDLDIVSSYHLLVDGMATPGEVFWLENQIGESLGARGASDNTDEDWRFRPFASATISPVFAFDTTGDGYAEIHTAPTGIVLTTPDSGGVLSVDAFDPSVGVSRGTPTLGAGEVVAPAEFVLRHEGRPDLSDSAIDVRTLRFQVTDENGDPWTQAQIDELLGADGWLRLSEQADERAGESRGALIVAEWAALTVDFDGFATLDLDDASGPLVVTCCENSDRRVTFRVQATSSSTVSVALPAEIHFVFVDEAWSATAGDVPVDVQTIDELAVAFVVDFPVVDPEIFADGFESGDTSLWL